MLRHSEEARILARPAYCLFLVARLALAIRDVQLSATDQTDQISGRDHARQFALIDHPQTVSVETGQIPRDAHGAVIG